MLGIKNTVFHKPVMVDEVIGFLKLEKAYKVLDGTVGTGGHAKLILEKIRPQNGFLIGVDCDENALKIAEDTLKEFTGGYTLAQANFRDIDLVLSRLGVDKIDGALFDLGLSSYQIEDSERGFSFMRDGSLDMRMDRREGLSAYDIVNRYGKVELESIIRDFGEERYYRRIVGSILERRRKSPINSTEELASIIRKSIGRIYKSKIHPATRTFQALRIAVNNEMDNLDKALTKILPFMNPGRRICVISFHSLEDRIVKTKFREFERDKKGSMITKKPVIPTEEEKNKNIRSRSAKLRVFERNV